MNMLSLVTRVAADPSLLFQFAGMTPDPWQRTLMQSQSQLLYLLTCRQAGKSTLLAAKAAETLLLQPGSLVLIVSPSERQSHETFRKALTFVRAVGGTPHVVKNSQGELELITGSRLVSLPGNEETLRGYSKVTLLLIDEAARVTDALYRTVRPMLAVSAGKLWTGSTPGGAAGWFYHDWLRVSDAAKLVITAHDCPRISRAFLDEERRAMGDRWVDQEYFCKFLGQVGLVFPDWRSFVHDLGDGMKATHAGMDFGFHNPCAALSACLHNGCLYILDEYYETHAGVSGALPFLTALGSVPVFCDPAGAEQIDILRKNDIVARKARNAIAPSIELITRLGRSGFLRIHMKCSHLIHELQNYRYGDKGNEVPIDKFNHAISALRYLVLSMPVFRSVIPMPIAQSAISPAPMRDDDDHWNDHWVSR